tara:strand:+ start:128 stop:517 length:390 start_codon:yes stop_codon:yes gene_type:complete
MKKLIVGICLMLVSTGSVAGAINSVSMGLSIEHYIEDRDKWNMAKFLDAYLMGLAHGIIYLNNEMAMVLPKEMVRGDSYMTTICASEHLNIKDVRKVLDNELRDNTYSLSLKVGLPLTNGLRKKFPCSY